MAATAPRLEVLHGYVLDKVYKRGNSVTGARFSHGGGDRLEVSARITVDATDLGDALPMSGTPYRIGMDARADTGEALAPAEANDIRGVYEHFMAWVSSNGAEHAEWYLESADAGRIY